MSCDVGLGCGSDSMLLWLWQRLAVVALMQSLGWEPPYAMGTALKKQNNNNNNNMYIYIQKEFINLQTVDSAQIPIGSPCFRPFWCAWISVTTVYLTPVHKGHNSKSVTTHHCVSWKYSSWPVNNHVASFKGCWWLVTAHLLFNSCTYSKACSYVAFLSLSDRLM